MSFLNVYYITSCRLHEKHLILNKVKNLQMCYLKVVTLVVTRYIVDLPFPFFSFSLLNIFSFSSFLTVLTFHIFPTRSSHSPPNFWGYFFLSFTSPCVYNFLLITSFLPNLYSLSSFLSKFSFLNFHLFILFVFLFSLQPIFLLRTHSKMWGNTKAS